MKPTPALRNWADLLLAFLRGAAEAHREDADLPLGFTERQLMRQFPTMPLSVLRRCRTLLRKDGVVWERGPDGHYIHFFASKAAQMVIKNDHCVRTAMGLLQSVEDTAQAGLNSNPSRAEELMFEAQLKACAVSKSAMELFA